MSWFKEWFNSEYYLTVYKHRDETEAKRLAELITKKLSINADSLVLDMACGAGRHAIEFAKNGFKVTAVDLSERLLSEAKQNAAKAGVNIEFVLSDILEYHNENKFQLVVNLFTSIGCRQRSEKSRGT